MSEECSCRDARSIDEGRGGSTPNPAVISNLAMQPVKILVGIKRVPDTEARIRLTGDGRDVDLAGVKWIINPYDEFALEAALTHRDAVGEGSVTVLTVGTVEAGETLRAALAMGADEAIVLEADEGGQGLMVATAIANDVRDGGFDLILFGMKAVDDDLQAVGPMVGELLDLPTVTAVSKFTVADRRLTAQRPIEGGVEVVEADLPCVVTVTKGVYEPRRASLKGIMAAKKKPLAQRAAEIGASGTREIGFRLPPDRQPGRIVGQGADAVPELVRLLREEAKVI